MQSPPNLGKVGQENICSPQAAEYLKQGWLPIPLNGKKPPKGFPLKKVLYANTIPLANLLLWFPPSYSGNIGIVTGASLIVVDYDSPDGITWGMSHFPPTPFIVKTGNNGEHHYYQYPYRSLICCRSGLWGKKIDLRASGGYVVAPPSIHPITGQAYQWVTPPEELQISDMPVFDSAWLPQQKHPPKKKSQHPARPVSKEKISRAKNYLSKISCISGQNAHDALFRAVCQLIDIFGITDETMLLEVLEEWNHTKCFDSDGAPYPWSITELNHKVRDALSR